ncbi:extracellular solute-binding protein [Microlunatus soli]|uniref:Multiple sugar transport system substrate-binding protein n=1 Tax=Microlunatus soli TaxID=630515 RepID=A0A1H2APC1_9ACTN|nr:extracellular solute-binding protein [Microlunatus soli]SDT47788.1 multiple sugar transport system substrate-binding protein [Microlunatus soli]
MVSHTRLTRRGLLRGGLGVAAGLGLAGGLSGCGSAFSAGVAGTELAPGTVTFWNLFGGGDGVRMQAMEDGYRKSPGAAPLQAATFSWGNPYYTKVSLATLGGAPPDVAVSHLTREKNLATGGLLSEITDDMLGLVGLSADDFNAKAWTNQKVDGKSYAIPLDTHPFVLFYNVDVCKKAGLLDADGKLKPIKGTAQWEDALKAAKEVTGHTGASVATVGDTATSWRWFQTLYSQRDGATEWLGDGGQELTYNEELVLDTLDYLRKLTKSGLMPATADYAGSQTMMFTGQSAFYMQGEWEISTAQAVKGLKFGMVPIPTLYDKPAEQADSHTLVLPKMDRTDAQVRRAMGFIKSLLDQSMTWAEGGHIPAYLPTLNSAAYKKLTPQSDYASAADYAVYDAPAWYSGSGSNFENVVGAQIGLVQQGLATPKAALAAARSQLLTYAKTENPL